MPYKDKVLRREWECSPEQREMAAERQQAARDRRDDLLRLAAVWEIASRCGHWRFCSEDLRARVEAREGEIRDLLEARARERVEVWRDGRRVRDF